MADLRHKWLRIVSKTAAVPVKDWEFIADNLSKAGWSWGCVATVDREGRTIWIVDAHGYGNRFVVQSDEKLTAFLELQRAIHGFAVTVSQGECCNQRKTGFASGEVPRIQPAKVTDVGAESDETSVLV